MYRKRLSWTLGRFLLERFPRIAGDGIPAGGRTKAAGPFLYNKKYAILKRMRTTNTGSYTAVPDEVVCRLLFKQEGCTVSNTTLGRIYPARP